MTENAIPRGVSGRADLLRLLAAAPREHLTLGHDARGWLGYARTPRQQSAPPTPDVTEAKAPADDTGERDFPTPLPLQLPSLYGILERRAIEPAAPGEAPPEQPPLRPGDPRAEPAASVCRAQDSDLVPRARLLPILRQGLAGARPGGVDLDKLVRQAARLNTPRHLPRRSARRWDPDLHVLLDLSEALWPYRHDFWRLRDWLGRECGRHALAFQACRDGPPDASWRMPPAGSRLLIVGDLGQLHPPQGPAAWLGFLERLRRARVEPLALVPLGAGQLDPGLVRAVPQLRWSPDAGKHPQRHAAPAPPPGLDELLAQCAALRRVDPALLRALRRINPAAPLDAGLEGALWNHPDVRAGNACDLNGAAGDFHRSRFQRLPAALQAATWRLADKHHAHLRAVVQHEETLHLAAHARPELQERMAAAIAAANVFFSAAASVLVMDRDSAWRAVIGDVLRRADAATAAFSPVFQQLAAACFQPGERLPAWAELPELVATDYPEAPYWLIEDAAGGRLLLSPRPPAARQIAYGPPLQLASLELRDAQGRRSPWIAPQGRTLTLAEREGRGLLELRSRDETLRLGYFRRPRGIAAWGRDGQGLLVQLPSLAGHRALFREDDLLAMPPLEGDSDPRTHLHSRTPQFWKTQAYGLTFGLDPYGAYADLELQGVTQRLRWIEPGEFSMGSPPEEPERDSGEGPRHRVRITRSFWLADTACTQALWQAVMGENPSRFQQGQDAPRRPVENVSWDDVQRFLERLRLPGADLPSEAEWEYACRAGTDTPFSFGANIAPEQVNYDGNYPYAGGNKGLYRESTVPVASLPANSWGLYEMHGNVWEWCADGLRDYADRPEADPRGPAGAAPRVVRGGSWFNDAGWARSASRSRFGRGYRDDDLGFRLALRSEEPSQAAEP